LPSTVVITKLAGTAIGDLLALWRDRQVKLRLRFKRK
jgi:hypothetical protein